ncbi:hypothetical protein NPIL_256791 [Nephila pilipes]|uniref:Uncharacterized protein n=1 Tax=Nephila pilipes TaxID=299642 RepID=A0A8X6QA38_NEPPI|nr:hypothetical protein NPIL_256791 [Nephila pilipes]
MRSCTLKSTSQHAVIIKLCSPIDVQAMVFRVISLSICCRSQNLAIRIFLVPLSAESRLWLSESAPTASNSQRYSWRPAEQNETGQAGDSWLYVKISD